MREIKFRGYDRKLKAMFPMHQLNFGKISNELESLYGVDIHDKDSDHSGDVSYGGHILKRTGNPSLPRFELMQFTGLKDKNGKEIYEGDFLLVGDRPHEVKWNDMNGQWATASTTVGWWYLDMNADWHEYGVVGNIYENSDLLK